MVVPVHGMLPVLGNILDILWRMSPSFPASAENIFFREGETELI